MELKKPIILLSIFLTNFCEAQMLQIPMNFNSNLGIYTIEASIGGNPAEQFVVDTGSGAILVVSNPSTCKNIQSNYVENCRFIPNEQTQSYGELIPLSYGSAHGYAQPYIGPIKIGEINIPDMHFFRAVQGTSIINIIGLGPIENMLNEKTFIDEITDKLKLNKQFTLQQCGTKGKSYLYIGDLPENLKKVPSIQMPFFSYFHYSLFLQGIYDEKGNIIASLKNNIAAVDNGAGSVISLHQEVLEQLNSYVLSTKADNQSKFLAMVNRNSLEGGYYCYNKIRIGFNEFPSVIFRFGTQNNKTIDIKLRPEDYFTELGCAMHKDTLGYAFDKRGAKHIPEKILQLHPTLLGGPFFRKFLVTFKLHPERIIELRPLDGLCN